jgi:hypothetical protein
MLSVARCPLHVVCCTVSVACCLLHGVRCTFIMLHAAAQAPGPRDPHAQQERERGADDGEAPAAAHAGAPLSHDCAAGWARACRTCTGTGARLCHICTGTGLAPAKPASGLGSPHPHLQGLGSCSHHDSSHKPRLPACPTRLPLSLPRLSPSPCLPPPPLASPSPCLPVSVALMLRSLKEQAALAASSRRSNCVPAACRRWASRSRRPRRSPRPTPPPALSSSQLSAVASMARDAREKPERRAAAHALRPPAPAAQARCENSEYQSHPSASRTCRALVHAALAGVCVCVCLCVCVLGRIFGRSRRRPSCCSRTRARSSTGLAPSSGRHPRPATPG